MSQRSEQGFTIIEILLAVVVLSIGVMALVGSSAMATRMIGRGNMSSRVTQVANARAELLRAYAAQTSPGCTNPNVASGNAVTNGVTEAWVVGAAAADGTRPVTMTFTYTVPGGTRSDVMVITLYCK